MIKKIMLKLKMKIYSKIPNKKNRFLRELGCKIGDNTRILSDINRFSEPFMIEIGENCLISTEVNFLTHDGGMNVLSSEKYFGKRVDKLGKIKIGNNVFIGNRVTIMPNVTIGNNVVVAAGSIITKNIDSDCVVGGIPAKFIMKLDEYYNKNKYKVHDTVGWEYDKKRLYYEKLDV